MISSHGAACSFSVGFSAALCDWPLILFTSIKRRPLIDVACSSSSSSIGIPAADKHINKPCAQQGKHIKAISLPSSGHLWGRLAHDMRTAHKMRCAVFLFLFPCNFQAVICHFFPCSSYHVRPCFVVQLGLLLGRSYQRRLGQFNNL